VISIFGRSFAQANGLFLKSITPIQKANKYQIRKKLHFDTKEPVF